MAGRIVVFGATGYTGELVARALVRDGQRPLLIARTPERVRALAAGLGGLDHDVADAGEPHRLRGLLRRGDVLVTTVGPFLQRGETALVAAIDSGATYLDSTGEPPFVARVFTEFDAPAADAGVVLLTAFGYDYVPGNLAGALALAEAGEAAARIDVGYFVTGRVRRDAVSTGTLASAAGILLEPAHLWRDGHVVRARSAASVRGFPIDGRVREGVSVGGSEHYTLPRLAPGLREVNVYLGWFGPASRAVQALSLGTALAARIPGADQVLRTLTAPLRRHTGGGPGERARAAVRTLAVAVASDPRGERLAEVVLRGPNPYDLTADLLAWGAARAASGELRGTGALGPVDAFGLETLTAGCASAGLIRS